MSGWLLLCIVAAITMMRMSPPPASPADAPPDTFSAGRAWTHLEAITRQPHPVGSAAAREVEQYLVRYLTGLGLRVEVQELPACTTLAELRRCAHVRNVLATFPGRDSEAAVLLSAHYDTVPNSLGAADDGAGVAALLETARALTSAGPRAHDVMFAFVDAEEELLLGSAALAQSARFAKVRLAGNFEARGSRGASALFAVSSGSAPIIEEFAAAVDRPIMNSFFSTVASLLPNGTDAEVYDRFGVKTLSFAFVEGVEHYHQGTDTPSNLSKDSLEHHGRYAFALARHFADTDLQTLVQKSGDAVFFDVGGWFVIRYPLWVARFLAVIVFALFAGTCWRQIRSGQTTLGAIAACAGIFLLFLGIVAVFATFIARAITIGWSTWAPFVHAPALAASIGCLAFAAFLRLLAFQCRRWGESATQLGPLVVCASLTIATGTLAPGASHVWMWPTGTAALIVFFDRRARPRNELANLLLLIPAFILQAQVLYTVVAVVGGGAIAVPMICAGLWMALIGPAIVPLAVRARFLWRGFALVGAVAAIAVSLVGRASAAPATGNSIAYAIDKAEKKALWISSDRDHDAWKSQFLGTSPKRARLSSFSSLGPLYFEAAPLVDLPEPMLVVESDLGNDERRELTLRVRSRRQARAIVVWETTGARFARWSFQGTAPLPIVRVSQELDEKGFRLLTGLGHEGCWTGVLLGVPADGALLRFETNDKGLLEFRVMDVSDELVLLPPEFRPRSAEWTTGHPGDQTWVSGGRLRVEAGAP